MRDMARTDRYPSGSPQGMRCSAHILLRKEKGASSWENRDMQYMGT